MTSFFPDLNVWLALSVAGHSHSAAAWNWLEFLPRETKLIFSRYTQIGLLRLLTNRAVMGSQTLTLREAWILYDRWLEDPRVEFYPELRGIDAVFRQITQPYTTRHVSKSIGDCYLLAFAIHSQTTLVTFDKALHEYARKRGDAVVIPA